MDEDYFVEDYKKNDKVIKKSTFNSLIIAIIIVTGIAAFFAGSFVSNLNSEQVSQKELENAIADRREFYNESVNNNNVRIEQFPDLFVARLFNFKTHDLLEFSDEEITDVDLGQLFDK